MFKNTAAASGMAMMLKSMGIDLPAIQELVEKQIQSLISTAQSIDKQLSEIKAQNERVLTLLACVPHEHCEGQNECLYCDTVNAYVRSHRCKA